MKVEPPTCDGNRAFGSWPFAKERASVRYAFDVLELDGRDLRSES